MSNIRVIQGEACIPQHKLVICDMKLVKNLKKRKEIFVSKCRIWKLKDDEVRKHFEKKIEARKKISSEGNVESLWKNIKKCLLEVSDEVMRKNKGSSKTQRIMVVE